MIILRLSCDERSTYSWVSDPRLDRFLYSTSHLFALYTRRDDASTQSAYKTYYCYEMRITIASVLLSLACDAIYKQAQKEAKSICKNNSDCSK